MLRSPPRSALSISAINGMKINLVLRRPRANCLFVLTTTHGIDLVSNVQKVAFHSPDENDTSDLSSDFNGLHYREKICVYFVQQKKEEECAKLLIPNFV